MSANEDGNVVSHSCDMSLDGEHTVVLLEARALATRVVRGGTGTRSPKDANEVAPGFCVRSDMSPGPSESHKSHGFISKFRNMRPADQFLMDRC